MATAVKHTQGPWKIRWSRDGSGDVGITADDLPNVLAECFADIRASGERATDEAAANARLIASAPELLAALESIVDLTKPGQTINLSQATDIICDVWNAARAAIAKTGGAK
jgi:hypothetical protein